MHRRMLSGGRYPVLRALAILYVIGAALGVLATIAGVGYIFARAPGTLLDRCIMSIAAIVGGFFIVVSTLALAEVLKLFIDIEHNTRMGSYEASHRIMSEAASAQMASVGEGDGRTNRVTALDEETAEAALLRGH